MCHSPNPFFPLCIHYVEGKGGVFMYGCNPYGGGYGGRGRESGGGSTFVLIVVLFILLIIVGSAFV